MNNTKVKLSLYGWLSAKLQITYAQAKAMMRGFKNDDTVYRAIMELYLEYYHGSWLAMEENELNGKLRKEAKALHG